MGKKKKKTFDDPLEDDRDASTDEENRNSASLDDKLICPHVNKAVNVATLKKSLKPTFLKIGNCGACSKEKRLTSLQVNQTVGYHPLKVGKEISTTGKCAYSTLFRVQLRQVQTNPTKNVKNAKITNAKPAQSGPTAQDLKESTAVWMCLKCAIQCCSTPSESIKEKHQIGHCHLHYKTPRSDLHCIFLHLLDWTLFCFECKDTLYIDSFKRLREAVEVTKRMTENKNVQNPNNSNNPANKKQPGGQPAVGLGQPMAANSSKPSNLTKKSSDNAVNNSNNEQKTRGLNNLGNTCFFNSIMQCLNQSHYLGQVLERHCKKGAFFETPMVLCRSNTTTTSQNNYTSGSGAAGIDSGMGSETSSLLLSDKNSDKSETENNYSLLRVESLSLQLNSDPGGVALAMAALFKDMKFHGKNIPVNPGQLFGLVCKRSPQFRGMEQQDAHELLRHLMDALRTEEVKRQKTAILKYFGLTEKTDPKTVNDTLKRKLQALGRHSNHTPIDKIFGGQLVSTIVCETCHNSSQIYEPFLDLSLSLHEEKEKRPQVNSGSKQTANNVNKETELEEESINNINKKAAAEKNSVKTSKKSKAQQKRAKKQERKMKQKNNQVYEEQQIETETGSKDNAHPDDESKEDIVTESPSKSDEKSTLEADTTKLQAETELVAKSETKPEEKSRETKKEKKDAIKTANLKDSKKENNKQPSNTKTKEKPKPEPEPEPEPSPEILLLNKFQALLLKAKKDQEEVDQMLNCGNSTSAAVDKFENAGKKEEPNKRIIAGSEEDDEDGFSIGEDEDWEWDYGEEEQEEEQQKPNEEETLSTTPANSEVVTNNYLDNGTGSRARTISTNSFTQQIPNGDISIPREKKVSVSLNPLPAERWVSRSSEEREKSSSAKGEDDDDDDEEEEEEDVSAGSCGDVEDNLDDVGIKMDSSINFQDTKNLLRSMAPFNPDPERLDPHMEALCRKVRKFSVSTANPNIDTIDGCMTSKNASVTADANFRENGIHRHDYEQLSDHENICNGVDPESELNQLRLQNDWIARSLTSIGPRYHAKSGECSIYSCLTQFTAPELLTGQNKWACDKCTRIHHQKAEFSSSDDDDGGNTTGTGNISDATTEKSRENRNNKKKPKTIYSNASKQLLIFCPPPVLTIHLKRFQQTMYNLRKVNKHVEFPINLNLAAFCSSTAFSMPNIQKGLTEIRYSLFGIVEHSGRLQGGHYTSYVKIRASDYGIILSDLCSPPSGNTEDIHSLLAEIERKSRVTESDRKRGNSDEESLIGPKHKNSSNANSNCEKPCKWYHISDTSVVEVSEEKVLKCQAYMLFYERIK